MTPRVEEALAAVWLTDYEPVRSSVQRQVVSYEQAEDITMAAFIELGLELEKRDVKNPGALVQTIATNRVTDYIRTKVSRGPHVSFDEAIDTDDELAQYRQYVDLDFNAGFDLAVRGLPEPERDAFILTELRGLTVRDAADVLGTSKSDVARRAASATTTIREELAA